MDLDAYQKFCKSIATEFPTPEHEIFTWGLGITGEAGDVASCIKKTYSHDNDQRQGIKENLGDTLWYAAMICTFFGWRLEDVFKENVDKLSKRYPDGRFKIEHARRNNTKIDWNEKT